MKLNELYAKTTNWTARHIIQDEIAMAGKNAEASQYILDKVALCEERENSSFIADLETRSMSSWSREELVRYSVLTGQSTAHL